MPEPTYTAIRFVYFANIVVAGLAGYLTLFVTESAARNVFGGTAESSPALRLVGAYWLSIAIFSAVGMWWPLVMSPVLLVQLFYKGGWLMAVAAPAYFGGRSGEVPGGLTAFFVLWVVILPFVIPWVELFSPAG